MGRNERFSNKARTSSLGKAVESVMEKNSSILNAIDFIESPQGLNVHLFPVQRIIVKAIFGVPIDYKEQMVPVHDPFCEKLLYTFTEREYIEYVHNENRCNVANWQDFPEGGFSESVIFSGRRGGKSQCVSALGGYALYKLLNVHSPQEYFGLVPGSPIDFTFMAQDDEGSNRLYDKLREDINRSPFFGTFLASPPGASAMAFITQADREKRDASPTIHVASYPCLDENELIWTDQGLTTIGETQIGDVVLDKFASKEKVSFKQCKTSEVIAIETTNFKGDPLVLTPEHTCVFVARKDAFAALPYLRTWHQKDGTPYDTILGHIKRGLDDVDQDIKVTEAPASEVAPGDYFLFPRIPEVQRQTTSLDNRAARKGHYQRSRTGRIHYRKPHSREVREFPVNPQACRLYGLYLAEGHTAECDGDPQFVVWDFHIKEKGTLAKFVQESLRVLFGLSSSLDTEPEKGKVNSCRVVCCSTELGRGLKAWFGKGCYRKFIPFQALYWPVECQKALIRGYLDGDGGHNRGIAPTTSRKLAYSLFALGIQAGLRPATNYYPAYLDKNGDPHAESWYTEFCTQERYYRFYQRIGKIEYYWSQVRSNRKLEGKRRVVDISVENSNSFLTKLGATHNCTTNAVRGPSSLFLALDEFAHFRSAKGASSDEVYDAATPSTMFFKNPQGEREAMIVSISSPLKKVGKMYDLHRLAMEKGVGSGIFTLRMGTAEMNPRSDSKFLRQKFTTSPMTWKAEYGGNFLESSETYVTEAQIAACTDQDRPNCVSFTTSAIGRQYFWAIDLGMINDATALGIGHLEFISPKKGVELVFDYLDRMMVGEKFEGPGVKSEPGEQKYVRHLQLPLEDILKWLRYMNNILPCFKGATDQHGGQQLVQLLELNRIHNIELLNLTPAINSQMYFALRGFIENVRCRFPNVPKFQNELKLVEAEFTNKYQIRVQAPAEKGSHDDMADVAALIALLAAEWLQNEKHLMLDPSGSSLLQNERAGHPMGLMPTLDSMTMSDIKIFSRQQKMMRNMGVPSFAVVNNPFHKRGHH